MPFLTDPDAHGIEGPAFDVVIPSLPGYGFSDRPAQVGVNYQHVAGLWHRLMRGLGYERYGAQGGDFGAGVATFMALTDPEPMIGVHLSNLEITPYTGPGARPLIRGGDNLSRAQCGILAGGIWLQGNPIDEAPDARIRAERLAGWARRLDSGEVALLGRFPR